MNILEELNKNFVLTEVVDTFDDTTIVDIRGDENDADYVYSSNVIEKEDLFIILPIFRKILEYGRHNWDECERYLSEDEIDMVGYYIPCGQYDSAHTIKDIDIKFMSSIDKKKYKINI